MLTSKNNQCDFRLSAKKATWVYLALSKVKSGNDNKSIVGAAPRRDTSFYLHLSLIKRTSISQIGKIKFHLGTLTWYMRACMVAVRRLK